MINKLQLMLMSIGYILAFFYAGVTYSPFRNNQVYPYVSSLFTLILGLLWGFLAKSSNTVENVYILGAVWDVGVSLIWILIPVLFFNVPLSTKQIIGVSLLISGCLLIKQ